MQEQFKGPVMAFSTENAVLLEKKNLLEKTKENLLEKGFLSTNKKVQFLEPKENIPEVTRKIKFE